MFIKTFMLFLLTISDCHNFVVKIFQSHTKSPHSEDSIENGYYNDTFGVSERDVDNLSGDKSGI